MSVGSLPSDWQRLPKLSILTLTNNSFSGSIPDAWGSMKSLGQLRLAFNKLTGGQSDGALLAGQFKRDYQSLVDG